jgi:hypothetical protein
MVTPHNETLAELRHNFFAAALLLGSVLLSVMIVEVLR